MPQGNIIASHCVAFILLSVNQMNAGCDLYSIAFSMEVEGKFITCFLPSSERDLLYFQVRFS